MTEPIIGYRDLTEDEVKLINQIKELGVKVGKLTDNLQREPSPDQRWVSIGITHLQQGLMALTRAVAKPTTF